MILCPNCNTPKTIKNGFTNGGSQRYLCKNCGYRFTNNTTLRKNDFYFTTMAVHLWLEGLTYNLISEIMGFTPETINKMLAPYREILLPVRKDLVSISDLRLTRKNNLFIGFNKEKLNLPTNASGIIIVGHETEIWGVRRKTTL